MRPDALFSIIYFSLFTVFYLVGISKSFVVFYLVLGVMGFVYFDHREKRKSKK